MRFSVIVPVYNAADFIGSCVMSVMNQTFGDWELLLVDDGSSDASPQMAAAAAIAGRFADVRELGL